MSWYAVDVTLTTRAREAVEYALTEAGASGTESALRPAGMVIEAGGERRSEARVAEDEFTTVTGYFSELPEVERVRDALREALRIYGFASSDVREVRQREVAERDWLAEWKKTWRPVAVGERFLVAPSWSEVAESGEGDARILIRIEPGMAFGTGTHETTRLCLAAVEKYFRDGSFLDVGTGTGILAIAAAKLSEEASVEACDTDPVAVTVAHENARANGVAERINFRVGSVEDDPEASAALVCANLTADVLLPMLPSLLSATRERLVISGILDTQEQMVGARLSELGATDYEVTREGEWIAMSIKR
ncbi:MAG TPA: 50S ribosomal protein L11 methyltransferase [Pyrinomonadaceae bacterium]|nr:50S ribosomal protein L11 methyltransferase [Pyrinomonadaceae bacterium]